MLENHLKINRRKFLQLATLGTLGLALGIEAVPAAAQKAPAAAGMNPIFTGALGRYEGVSIIHSPGDWLDEAAEIDRKFFEGDQWSKAQRELLTRGSTAIKVNRTKARWIPFNKMNHPGGW